MKRSVTFFALVLAFILGFAGAMTVGFSNGSVDAQDVSTQDHPLVGTWLANTDPENQPDPSETFTFSSDGTYIDVDSSGSTTLGSWEATGENTATLTIVGFESDDDEESTGSVTIRATIEVSEDGNSFTAEYTLEFIDAEGTSTGEAGPGAATGTRLLVEAPGTPVMSLEELFGSFEESEESASPEATPTS